MVVLRKMKIIVVNILSVKILSFFISSFIFLNDFFLFNVFNWLLLMYLTITNWQVISMFIFILMSIYCIRRYLMEISRKKFVLFSVLSYVFFIFIGIFSLEQWKVITIIFSAILFLLDFSFIKSYMLMKKVPIDFIDENYIRVKVVKLKVFISFCIIYIYFLLLFTDNEESFLMKNVANFIGRDNYSKGFYRLFLTLMLLIMYIVIVKKVIKNNKIKLAMNNLNSRIRYLVLNIFKSGYELSYNPLKIKYELYDDDIGKKLKKINSVVFYRKSRSKSIKKNGLNLVEKSKKNLNDGDVFIVQPLKDVYFYGKVLRANVDHFDKLSKCNNKSVVVIFNIRYNKSDNENLNFNYENILVEPCFVEDFVWKADLFRVLYNKELTGEEKRLDYGFYNNFLIREGGNLVDFKGERLLKKPKFISYNRVYTANDIARLLYIKFTINPEILGTKYILRNWYSLLKVNIDT